MFIKTPNIWDPVIRNAIDHDCLRLQSSQWVRCGADNDHAAMWVGRSPGGTLYVAHWQGSRRETLRRYHSLKQGLDRQLGRVNA